MHQVADYPLWLGHAGDAGDFKRLFDTGIQAVMQLAMEEAPVSLPRELLYVRFPLVDGPGNDRTVLYLALITLTNLLEKQVPTLVCCGAGLSRSPALAAAALAMVYQEKPDDCLRQIAAHQPHDVAPGFWLEVKKVFQDTTGVEEA